MVTDITEHKRLQQQLSQAKQLEAIGGLAGGVAHDFNNSMMAIRGFAELLLGRLEHDDPSRRDAEGINRRPTEPPRSREDCSPTAAGRCSSPRS